MALVWTLSNMFVAVLCWEAPNWTQLSRRISVLDMLLLVKSRRLFAILAVRTHCWSHGQLVVRWHPQVFLHQAAIQTVGPQPVLVHCVIPTQGQDFAFAPVELHEILLSPFLQPVNVPLNGSKTLN